MFLVSSFFNKKFFISKNHKIETLFLIPLIFSFSKSFSSENWNSREMTKFGIRIFKSSYVIQKNHAYCWNLLKIYEIIWWNRVEMQYLLKNKRYFHSKRSLCVFILKLILKIGQNLLYFYLKKLTNFED